MLCGARMSAGLLHYRTWQGRMRGPWCSVWPIARVALGNLLRRRLFWVLYAFACLLFLMFFFGTYLLAWAESQLPEDPNARLRGLAVPAGNVMRLVRRALQILNGSQETFAYFFVYQGSMVMVILTLAGAVLVGNDFTHRSLSFYLAKPINRWHYILGKCLAVAIVLNLVTTLPALVLFSQHAMGDWDYLVDSNYFISSGLGAGPAGPRLLVGIVAFGLLLSTFLSVMLVATASWVRRTLPLVMVWTTLFMFLRLLANILVDGLQHDARWRLVDLWNSICLLGFAGLGYDHGRWPTPQPSYLEAGLVLLGVSTLCLIYLNQRTRAVDVIK